MNIGRLHQLQENERDLTVAIRDTHSEIDNRLHLLSDFLDQLRTNRAEQLRCQRARAEYLDFLACVEGTFGHEIAEIVDDQEAARECQ